MAVNKVQRKNGEVILDVTGVTASPADVVPGKKFVNAEGVLVDGTMPSAEQATPTISVSSNGLITASATQTAGRVAAGTKSATKQLPTQGAKTVTPTATEQVAVEAGVYTTGAVKVAAVTSYNERTAFREGLQWLQASDLYALYADVPKLIGGAYTIRAHVESWLSDSVHNNPTAYPNSTYRAAVTQAFDALDAYAASAGGGTVVSGQIYADTRTLTISGLTFSKIKSIYFGVAARSLSNYPSTSYTSVVLSGSIIDGMSKDSVTYASYGTVYTSANVSKWFSYSYSNGTLTINASSLTFADYFNYFIVGI